MGSDIWFDWWQPYHCMCLYPLLLFDGRLYVSFFFPFLVEKSAYWSRICCLCGVFLFSARHKSLSVDRVSLPWNCVALWKKIFRSWYFHKSQQATNANSLTIFWWLKFQGQHNKNDLTKVRLIWQLKAW